MVTFPSKARTYPSDGAQTDAVAALALSAMRRLAQSRRTAADGASGTVSPLELRAFVELLLSSDVKGAVRLSRRIEKRGDGFTCVADDLLAAAARRLGERWEDDTLSFVDVTVGVSTLFRVNACLRRDSHASAPNDERRAVFATLPGQTHTLGIILAAEAFRRSDWDVALQLEADADTVVDAVEETHASLVGFTAGRETSLQEIGAVIQRLKTASRPPRILLGGICPNTLEGAAAETGADIVVSSIEEAVIRASKM